MRPYFAIDYTNWDTLTNDSQVRPIFFVSIAWGDGTTTDTTFQYKNPSGTSVITTIGAVLDIQFPKDNIKREKTSFSLLLNGDNPTLLQKALDARQQIDWPSAGKDIALAYVDLWFLDSTDKVDSQYSLNVAEGLLESLSIDYQPGATTINAVFQHSRDWIWDRPIEGRYTDVYQKSIKQGYGGAVDFSADKGFEYVEKLQDWDGFWAKPKAAKKPGKKKKHKKKRRKGRK